MTKHAGCGSGLSRISKLDADEVITWSSATVTLLSLLTSGGI